MQRSFVQAWKSRVDRWVRAWDIWLERIGLASRESVPVPVHVRQHPRRKLPTS